MIFSLMPLIAWIIFCIGVGIEMRRSQKRLDIAYELYFGRREGE